MRSTTFLALSSAFLSINACMPDFAGRKVTIGVSGRWNAVPVAPNSPIVPVDNTTMTFSVVKVTAEDYMFTTSTGKFAVSGANGPLTLQKADPKDMKQRYFFASCGYCNVDGKKASARGCSVRAASNHSMYITHYGFDPVKVLPFHPRAPGQFAHFDEV